MIKSILKSDDFKIKNFINYIVIAAALVVCIILFQAGELKTSYVNLLVQIGYSIILAVSLNLVVGFLGELSLGHAGFMCVGAYLGTFISIQLSEVIESKVICLLISMIFGGLIAAVFGFLVGLPALRLKGDYLAIVTLAFGEIVRTVFKNLPKELFGGAMGLSTNAVKFTKRDIPLFIIVFIVVILTLFFVQNLVRSKHGRAITAIRDNEIAAKAMGINVTFYKLFVFVIAAFFAGVAGVFYGHYATPVMYTFFSYNYSIEILVMVVLGGMGSINGSIIAATLIPIINYKLQEKLPGDLAALKFLIYAVILIGIVIFNNAPKLAPIKERLSVKALIAKVTAKNRKPEDILNDPAHWDRIPTKIAMDEVLSTDIQPGNEYVPDKPAKGGK
ncbi:MAG: branched-chain amino acid ABC transporter permease [Ruminococcaceae bacterium]|nr:branched-chain amino acid ABC transporter permease [Oscillospiraceae bacterium]MBR3598173.1 branched-chain amino acid ABC transporter permease [Clostridia bacterium]